VTGGRPGRRGRRSLRPVVLAAAVALTSGCDTPVAGEAVTAPAPSAPSAPDRAAELEPLLVEEVPSGLPRLPDGQVMPPAGEKTVEDVAGYADDPAHERAVLDDYGYRFGWERFWGVEDGALTSVFVHQLRSRAGAAAYARDLAANDAGYYAGSLAENPPDLPGGCWLLTVEDPRDGSGLDGPAAISWCASGVFSVSVTAVADSLGDARAEVRELLPIQLDRLQSHGG
jgi:hypothetical protein